MPAPPCSSAPLESSETTDDRSWPLGVHLIQAKAKSPGRAIGRYLHVVRLFLNGLQLGYSLDVSMRQRLGGERTNRGPERTRYWQTDA